MCEVITSNYNDKPVVAAYLDNKLQYLSVATRNTLDNIYLCRVDNIVKNLNSAFVRFEEDENGYVPLKSITPAVVAGRDFSDKDSIRAGDELILQISSESVKTKKPKLTPFICLTGKLCVVTLGKRGVGASLKLSDEVRNRLIDLVKPGYQQLLKDYEERLYGTGFGVIIRTEAQALDEGQAADNILSDITSVADDLARILKEGRSRKAPTCLMENHSGDIDNHVERAVEYLKRYRPEEEISVKEDTGIHGLKSDIDKLLGNRVWLKSGAYLIIEQLESFNAIDVNTGKAIAGKGDVISRVNFEAADEIMRQIRLRNLTGMILIDFINMKADGDRQELCEYVEKLCKRDPVHTRFIDITGLGIIEITRNKNNPSIRELLC